MLMIFRKLPDNNYISVTSCSCTITSVSVFRRSKAFVLKSANLCRLRPPCGRENPRVGLSGCGRNPPERTGKTRVGHALAVRIDRTMTVIVHRFPAHRSGRLNDRAVQVMVVSAADLESDGIASLLAAASLEDDGFPPLAAKGLAADVRGRSGRVVWAWAAVRADGTVQGVISLAVSTVGGHRRFSVPWLVVDPRDRRRGVGEALVRVALAAAEEAGATDVGVETLASWGPARAFWARIARLTGAAGAEHDRRDWRSPSAESFLEPEA